MKFSSRDDEEIYNLIKSIDIENLSSFETIKKILDFTATSEVNINEKHVQQNLDFFVKILDYLNRDLSALLEDIQRGKKSKDGVSSFVV